MRTVLILLIIATILSACKARQMAPAEPAEPPVDEQITELPEEPEEAPVEIPVIKESFEFEQEEDEIDHQVNQFFVILGSFRVSENANRFKSHLEEEGFAPVILISETGFHRVSVDSYSDEADARQRVLQIRRDYPEYHDAWLLIRRDI